MAQHVWDTKVIEPKTVFNMLKWWKSVKDEIGPNNAKKYAVYCIERQRQGGVGWVPAPLDRMRAYKVRKEYSVAVFNRLLQNARYGPYEAVDVKELKQYIVETALMDPKCQEKKEQFEQAKHNYLRIGGLTEEEAEKKLGFKLPEFLINTYNWNWLAGWEKIKRGRDLFIKGLGGFDIQEALADMRLPFPELGLVVACGYTQDMTSAYAFRNILRSTRKREYMVRYWHSFFKQNTAVLDELGWYRGEDYNCRPEVFIERRREEARQRARQWQVNREESLDFTWLNNAPEIKTEVGTLRALKNPTELLEVGQEMKNCAAGYDGTIGLQRGILVALFNEQNKPICLGHLTKEGSWPAILGKMNRTAPKEHRAVYKEHTEVYLNLLNSK